MSLILVLLIGSISEKNIIFNIYFSNLNLQLDDINMYTWNI